MAMIPALVLVFLALFPFYAKAADPAQQFCIMPIENPTGVMGVQDIRTFEAHAPIFYLGADDSSEETPVLLEGEKFVSLQGDFPEISTHDRFVELPDGRLIGHTKIYSGPYTPLYQQDKSTGQFKKLTFAGEEKLARIDNFIWSDVLQGIVIASQAFEQSPHGVYLFKDDKLETISGTEGWMTGIFDFPDVKLTVLSAEESNDLYVIDATKTLHKLGVPEAFDSQWVREIFYLKNPDRLLVVGGISAEGVHGLYLLPIVTQNGVKTILPQTEFTNILPKHLRENFYGRYVAGDGQYVFVNKDAYEKGELYEVGATTTEKVIEPATRRAALAEDISSSLYERSEPSAVSLGDAFYMPPSGTEILLDEDAGVLMVDKVGNKTRVGQQDVKIPAINKATMLLYSNDLFINAENGPFLLREQAPAGNCR